MKYLKLFIPLLIPVLQIIISERYFERGQQDVFTTIVIKGGLLIYYLRLSNSKTPLINTLTGVLLFMTLGEYFLQVNPSLGQVVFIVSNLALGVTYFIRQKLKVKKDKLNCLKTGAVSMFALTNILSVDIMDSIIPVAIGTLFLISIYFYDRLTKTEAPKLMEG